MTMSIPCPKCGAILKLRDASLLGKTGKCPKCEHRFVLRDPDEVEMELVESPAPGTGRASSAPKVGTGGVWVPDGAPAASASVGPAPVIIAAAETDPFGRQKRKRRKRNPAQTIAMLAGVVILGVGGLWLWKTYGAALTSAPVAGKKAKSHKSTAKATTAEDSGSDSAGEGGVVAQGDENEYGRPTHGKPIDLLWMPSGARIIVSLRPAELWKAGALGEGEFIAGLGPLGVWLESWMKDSLMAEPKQIEHALICLFPGSPGTQPEVAAVVQRTADSKFKKSDMIEKFAGQAIDTSSVKYYTNEKRAMVLRPDMLTYALCPASLAAEMVDASEIAKPTDGGIEELLLRTDRDLQFTVVCVPADLRIHGEVLAPAEAQPFLQNVADWVSSDDEAEAVALSFHLTDQKFYLQLMARNSAVIKPHQLAKSFKSQLTGTPRRILETVQMMNPPQLGKRKVIGRVPAMSKVVQLGTQVETYDRLVSLHYEGPERAGPNLALGTLLAWDESTRTKFGSSTTSAAPAATAERKPLKTLLKSKIDVDFRRVPLEDAFNYIAGEAKFEITVDGDALKAAGYTKNMPQTFKDEGIAASAALGKIITLGKYDKMCFVIDEAKSLVTVTTVQAAEDKKLKIYEMK